jgi:hypothetical protein
MTTEQELKIQLQHIRENDYFVPEDKDAYPFAQILLDFIGSSDAELRDNLIYGTIARWINRGEFRHKELRGLLLQVLSTDALFHRTIGNFKLLN